MQVKFVGIVKRVKDWDVNGKTGEVLPPDKVTHQVTFFDRKTGGDVVITFPAGYGPFEVGQELTVEAEVQPYIKNYNNALQALPLPDKPSKK